MIDHLNRPKTVYRSTSGKSYLRSSQGGASTDVPPVAADDGDSSSWEALCKDLAAFSQLHVSGGPEAAEGAQPSAEKLSWAEFNKAMRGKAAQFAGLKPGGAIALLKPVMRLNMDMLYHSLKVSSDDWDREQGSKGSNVRCYRVLDEYGGKHVHSFYDGLKILFFSVPKAIPKYSLAKNMRTLLFRLLSRAGASHHQLLDRFRQGFPTKLFGALLGNMAVLTARPCLLDELSTKIRDSFKTEAELSGEDGQAVLHCLASVWDLDIVAIEAKHATVRRMIVSRSNQAPAPSVSVVSADFAIHQMAKQHLLQESWKGQQAARLGRFGRKQRKQGAKEADDAGLPLRKKRKRASQPGGPWKAFVHVNAKGVRVTKETGKRMSDEYRNLTPEQTAWYHELGEAARISGLAGHKPFPEVVASHALVPDHTPENLNCALVELRAQMRKESADRQQQRVKVLDALHEASSFEKQPPEHVALMQSVLGIQEFEQSQFRFALGANFAMAQWVPPVWPFAKAAWPVAVCQCLSSCICLGFGLRLGPRAQGLRAYGFRPGPRA